MQRDKTCYKLLSPPSPFLSIICENPTKQQTTNNAQSFVWLKVRGMIRCNNVKNNEWHDHFLRLIIIRSSMQRAKSTRGIHVKDRMDSEQTNNTTPKADKTEQQIETSLRRKLRVYSNQKIRPIEEKKVPAIDLAKLKTMSFVPSIERATVRCYKLTLVSALPASKKRMSILY